MCCINNDLELRHILNVLQALNREFIFLDETAVNIFAFAHVQKLPY